MVAVFPGMQIWFQIWYVLWWEHKSCWDHFTDRSRWTGSGVGFLLILILVVGITFTIVNINRNTRVLLKPPCCSITRFILVLLRSVSPSRSTRKATGALRNASPGLRRQGPSPLVTALRLCLQQWVTLWETFRIFTMRQVYPGRSFSYFYTQLVWSVIGAFPLRMRQNLPPNPLYQHVIPYLDELVVLQCNRGIRHIIILLNYLVLQHFILLCQTHELFQWV